MPMHWAATKTDLGMALLRLGEREGGTATSEEAVRVLRQALEVRTRDRGEMPWAATLADLAEALLALGRAGGPPSAFADAATACRSALEVLTPDAWADNCRRVHEYLEAAEAAEAGAGSFPRRSDPGPIEPSSHRGSASA